jgi:hypothetical protein
MTIFSFSALTLAHGWASLRRMTENQETIKEPRVNISVTGEHASELEQLREFLERRLKQRLSMAQIIKRLTKDALIVEKALAKTIPTL